MLSTLLSLSLTLAALPGPIGSMGDKQAVGFTQDGEMFVIKDAYSGADEGYTVYDVRSGTNLHVENTEELTPAQFQAWVAENPLAPLKNGPRSPDGKSQIEAGKHKAWKDGQLLVQSVCDDEESPKRKPRPSTLFRVKTGKKSWASADLDLGQWNANSYVEPLWSPDGRRVAYLVHIVDGCYGATAETALWFGPAQGPRVQVLRVKERASSDVADAMLALEGAGFAPTAEGDAKGSHAGTVVFAAKGFEAEAKKAAAALPGAKVEMLTWKAGFELVVVLGGK